MRTERISGAEPARQMTATAKAVADEQNFKAKLSRAQAAAEKAESAGAGRQADDKKLRAACRDLEAVFINMMLTTMRSTVAEGGLVEKSSGEKVMQSMLDRELAGNMAKAGGIGLGDLLYRQLSAQAYKTVAEPKNS